jgi:hypothetical protein
MLDRSLSLKVPNLSGFQIKYLEAPGNALCYEYIYCGVYNIGSVICGLVH